MPKQQSFFIQKLYQAIQQHRPSIVDWDIQGKGFIVNNLNEFTNYILLRRFGIGRLDSFARKLNRHGFKRSKIDKNKIRFFHKYFHRQSKNLQKIRKLSKQQSLPKHIKLRMIRQQRQQILLRGSNKTISQSQDIVNQIFEKQKVKEQQFHQLQQINKLHIHDFNHHHHNHNHSNNNKNRKINDNSSEQYQYNSQQQSNYYQQQQQQIQEQIYQKNIKTTHKNSKIKIENGKNYTYTKFMKIADEEYYESQSQQINNININMNMNMDINMNMMKNNVSDNSYQLNYQQNHNIPINPPQQIHQNILINTNTAIICNNYSATQSNNIPDNIKTSINNNNNINNHNNKNQNHKFDKDQLFTRKYYFNHDIEHFQYQNYNKDEEFDG